MRAADLAVRAAQEPLSQPKFFRFVSWCPTKPLTLTVGPVSQIGVFGPGARRVRKQVSLTSRDWLH